MGEDLHFEHAAQEATLLDYLHEVEHMADRIGRLEGAIDEAVKKAPTPMRSDPVDALRQEMRSCMSQEATTTLTSESTARGGPRVGDYGSSDSSRIRSSVRRGSAPECGTDRVR
jgi:hypothetical protein